MKCIQCGTDNTLKDRTSNNGRCKTCRQPFAFEPTSVTHVKITDPLFAKVITDLSAENTLFFTPKQFFYALDRRLRGKGTLSVPGCLMLYLFAAGVLTAMVGSGLAQGTKNAGLLWVPALIVTVLVIVILYGAAVSDKANYRSRKNSAQMLRIVGGLVLLVGLIAGIITESFWLVGVGILLGLVAFLLGNRQMRRVASPQLFLFSLNQFQDWLKRWQLIHDPIEKLLPAPREEQSPAPVNPDVTAYSFDRLVVCDSANIAQLLIANNFHFENNCAILSITGYPQSIFEITMQMLRRNPNLEVYVLHDCSPRGVGLAHRIRTSPQWFQDTNVVIIDVGLLPRQILAAKQGIFIQSSPESAQAAQQLATEVLAELSPQEVEWLKAGNFVELESFTPQKLIQVLNRGIAGSRSLDSDDSSLILVDNSGTYLYTVDSFG